MLRALLWGAVAASSLVVGVVVALRVHVHDRVVGLLMGFGAGTLISAVSFDLSSEALRLGGRDALGFGLAAGAVVFYLGDRYIETHGHATRPRGSGASAGAAALVLGALLDGIPEQAAIGLGLASGGSVGVALVAAVFLSNVPESVASAVAMREAGRRPGHILALWAAVAVVCALASVVGYVALKGVSGNVQGAVQGFAAGAILVMLVTAMVPDALKDGGRSVGLVTVLGFAAAVFLSQLD